MVKEIICTVCPRGCHISVEGEGKTVNTITGEGCKRGVEYATAEFIAPVRILTTLVKIEGRENELLPVRSNKPLLKEKLFDAMAVIKGISVKAPVNMYDIIVKDICGTGVDIVATKDIKQAY